MAGGVGGGRPPPPTGGNPAGFLGGGAGAGSGLRAGSGGAASLPVINPLKANDSTRGGATGGGDVASVVLVPVLPGEEDCCQ